MSNDKRFQKVEREGEPATLSQILANDERFHELMPEGEGPAPSLIQQFHRDVDHLRTRLQEELTDPHPLGNPMQLEAMECIWAGSIWDAPRTSQDQRYAAMGQIRRGYLDWRLANDDAFWTEIHKWIDTLDTLR
jgi:hypothetical protein